MAILVAMDDLGARVRRLRQQAGISGAQMARNAIGKQASDDEVKAYVDRLSKLERGEPGHTNPTLERLELLAAGLRLSLGTFFAQLEVSSPTGPTATSVQPVPTDPVRAIDEGLAQLSPSEIRTAFEKVGQAFAEYARERESERRTPHRSGAADRAQSTDDDLRARIDRATPAPRRLKRPGKKP